ncbi:LysR family transcriptional regulator [Listeria seeligeri]|uniref:LysR family transcriptional regulator n=1 Tax=Listeria seeligeri TaxID=1640 RepID=UPI001886B844|nr:LysR family transcriptional regulator [Listeria seeligeri]MBF2553907.1 LysR family transcriptional regulator [Listeria seeligeri]
MDYNQLHYFIVTAETGHLTHASEKLSLSQSALSRSIAALEAELGLPLFDRKNRSIQLNQVGKVFLADAKEIQLRWLAAQEKIQTLANPNFGEVTVSFVPTLGLSFMPQLLKKIQQNYPTNTLRLKEAPAQQVLKDVLTNASDIGISTVRDKQADLEYIPLFTEKFVLIMSKENKLATKNDITLQDIAEEEFIHFAENTYSREVVEHALKQAKVDLKVRYDGLEISSILGLVEANMGISIVPKTAILDFERLEIFPIETPKIERTIYLVHAANGYISSATKRFIQFTENKMNS